MPSKACEAQSEWSNVGGHSPDNIPPLDGAPNPPSTLASKLFVSSKLYPQ